MLLDRWNTCFISLTMYYAKARAKRRGTDCVDRYKSLTASSEDWRPLAHVAARLAALAGGLSADAALDGG
jgi:hypothetical protein